MGPNITMGGWFWNGGGGCYPFADYGWAGDANQTFFWLQSDWYFIFKISELELYLSLLKITIALFNLILTCENCLVHCKCSSKTVKTLGVLRGHSHIESSHSLHQIDANGWVGGSSSLMLRFDTWNWLLLNYFLILRKNNSSNKDKPSENPFKITKIWVVFNCIWIVISPKPSETSIKSNSVKKFEKIVSTADTSPIFQFFWTKKILRKSSKPGLGNLLLINFKFKRIMVCLDHCAMMALDIRTNIYF